MSDGARVNDLEAIRSFRAAMVKFIEAGSSAVVDSEGEILKKMSWLESEQDMFWQQTIRKLHELVNRCKEQVRMKKLFKDSSGRTASAVDEEKQLKITQAKLAEAEQKHAATKRYAKQLQREHLMYRGGVQRLQTMLSSDLPNGVAMLEAVLVKLDAYLSAAPAMVTSEAGFAAPPPGVSGESSGDENMKRAAEPDANEGKVAAVNTSPEKPPQQDEQTKPVEQESK